MKFIEMTGHALMSMIEPDEVSPEKLQQVGLTDTCLVRVNEQGDVEVRRHDRWDLIGGFSVDLLNGQNVPAGVRGPEKCWIIRVIRGWSRRKYRLHQLPRYTLLLMGSFCRR